MHQVWRDCKAWSDEGLRMSTTNNEACKLYDAVLSQYVGWYDDNAVGGLESSSVKMLQADEDFIMGHVISTGMDLIGTGTCTRLDKTLASRIENLLALSQKDFALERERKHANAVKLWADGFMSAATDVWEDILIESPHDMLAIKFCHDSYFYLGHQNKLRDSIARVMPHWQPSMPHYGLLHGMYSFGLVETNLFEKAEQVARKGLEIYKHDCWSTHSLAHVYEMTGKSREGRAFMTSTESDWSPMGMLACHLYWHWALYDIEEGNHSDAVQLFDSEINKRVRSGALLDIVDACSLLFRLELEGVDVEERWKEIYDICWPHKDDHILAFNDVHILMACLGSKNDKAVKEFTESLRNFAENCAGDNASITKAVGIAICEALIAYADNDFAKAVDLLLPKRYDVIQIGGSDAQRDLFKLFLIISALKSPRKQHKCLARQLLSERKALKENSPMTDRLMSRAMSLHLD